MQEKKVIFVLNLLGKTQKELLQFLLNHKSGKTIEEIASHLNVTRTAVVQHITSLQAEGLIQSIEKIRDQGRPAKLYSLTSQGIDIFPKQYSWFASLLVSYIKNKNGESGLESVMENLALDVAKQVGKPDAHLNPKQKLLRTVEIMNSLSYSAQLEESDSELSICATNCVFHDLAKENPEICTFDTTLIGQLADSKPLHSQCMRNGDSQCKFSFKK